MHTQELVRQMLSQAERIEEGEHLPGSELACVLKELVSLEIAEGGPYALVPGTAVPDLGVNLAAERFLLACGVTLPALDRYLEQALLALPYSSAVFSPEALASLAAENRVARARKEAPPAPPSYAPEEEAVLALLRVQAAERFQELSAEFAERCSALLERTIARNADKQMTLMPLYVRQALGKKGQRFSDEYVARLGLANAFFWSAFIVYDDFWDEDEAADPKLLPAANFFARHFVEFFSSLLPEKTGYRRFFHAVMDRLDTANAWETARCRMRVREGEAQIPDMLPAYGDYGVKYYPAAGHVMGPVALLVKAGCALDSEGMRCFLEYCKHYLVAMQLNDDAHDWKEDLMRGHLSTAVVALLERWKQTHPERAELDLAADLPELERLFWQETLDGLCADILDHCQTAREMLTGVSAFLDPAPLALFIDRSEHAARRALAERERAAAFLEEFSS